MIAHAYIAPVDGIYFGATLDQDSLADYIFTSDPAFATDGFRIGDSFAALKRALPRIEVFTERGWSTYAPLPSGWAASFRFLESPDTVLGDSARVLEFFKR